MNTRQASAGCPVRSTRGTFATSAGPRRDFVPAGGPPPQSSALPSPARRRWLPSLLGLGLAAWLSLAPSVVQARLAEVPDAGLPSERVTEGAAQPDGPSPPAADEGEEAIDPAVQTEPRPLSVPPLTALEEETAQRSGAEPTDAPDQDPSGQGLDDQTPATEVVPPTPPVAPRPPRPPLPDWLQTGDGEQAASVEGRTVHSDYHASEREARRALEEELVLAVNEYIAEYLHEPRAPLFLRYSLQEIKSRLLKPEYQHHEIREFGFGIMHQTHAMLEFPLEFRQELDRRWQQVQQGVRVLLTASVALGVVLGLVGIFGYLRVEQRTGGSFAARLQFLAVTAILVVILGALFWSSTPAEWLYWLVHL
jgi:hypothetical protein